MSSTAPQLRSRIPRIAEAAVQRARLTVVPRQRPRARTRAPRVPFVTLVSLVLLGGVVGLLLFNTSMQQASFRATALEGEAGDLAAREEALRLELQELRDPQRIAAEAQAMGMVIPTSPAGVLDLATGSVEGEPQPATPDAQVPLSLPGPSRPVAADANTDRNGAPDRDRDRARPRLGRER